MVIFAISPSKDIRHGLRDEEAHVGHVDPEPHYKSWSAFCLAPLFPMVRNIVVMIKVDKMQRELIS